MLVMVKMARMALQLIYLMLMEDQMLMSNLMLVEAEEMEMMA